ncbi:MAG: glycogen/starch/alpha-glucan phosphorylase [Pseudomonadota bacterium]
MHIEVESGSELFGSFPDDVDRHYALTLGLDSLDGRHAHLYEALVLTLRDRLVANWRETQARYKRSKEKQVAYLSMEFLVGRSLHNAIHALGLDAEVQSALTRYACQLEEVESEELDAGLGNGGLGRLAACFLDSCASLDLPVTGYGIRYEYGMFRQELREGHQVEVPDRWLRRGNPWEFRMLERARCIHFGGRSETYQDEHGKQRYRWVETHDVIAVPYDMPVPGYRNSTVNTLRLWRAEATNDFDLNEFNAGSYTDAVEARTHAEQITMVLYPNDQSEAGKELRLKQQYFLASASLQDVLARWIEVHGEQFSSFADGNCLQLNDTHPTIAIPELMRLLMDEHRLGWDEAWSITRKSFAYTNHTLLPEALEQWPVELLRKLLPRLLEIIFEINSRFLATVAQRWPSDLARLQKMSIVREGYNPTIRMAYLGIVGSFSVNGVAALHTKLLCEGLFRDFFELSPEKFNNKTNGVTPRRWLAFCNPDLAELIDSSLRPRNGVGDDQQIEKSAYPWLRELTQLQRLADKAGDSKVVEQFRTIKKSNKQRLVKFVQERCAVTFDAEQLFDVQVKRIHEYKRQLLNILHVIHRYDRILRGDTDGLAGRCVLIAGKAAPGYVMAKRIIKLINSVAAVVNQDERAWEWLRVAFLADYNVSAMEVICPGADLSEQISTAGKEASGTGNMKFMMNGALTIGTLDGANIEMLEAVGKENFFLFGHTADEIRRRTEYNPDDIIAADEDLRRVVDLIESGLFNPKEPGIFDEIVASIRSPGDLWNTAGDFRSYVEAQKRVDALWSDSEQWHRCGLLNTAASGMFSSDRTIGEYGRDIWFSRHDGTKPQDAIEQQEARAG